MFIYVLCLVTPPNRPHLQMFHKRRQTLLRRLGNIFFLNDILASCNSIDWLTAKGGCFFCSLFTGFSSFIQYSSYSPSDVPPFPPSSLIRPPFFFATQVSQASGLHFSLATIIIRLHFSRFAYKFVYIIYYIGITKYIYQYACATPPRTPFCGRTNETEKCLIHRKFTR